MQLATLSVLSTDWHTAYLDHLARTGRGNTSYWRAARTFFRRWPDPHQWAEDPLEIRLSAGSANRPIITFLMLHGGLRPCIIVLDLAMPMATGYVFRQEQMAYAEFSDIPAVLFSASHELSETARQLDVVAYAAKPINSNEVLAIIRKYCPK